MMWEASGIVVSASAPPPVASAPPFEPVQHFVPAHAHAPAQASAPPARRFNPTWDLFSWTYADGERETGDEMPLEEEETALIRELVFLRNDVRFQTDGIRKHLSHPTHEALLGGGLPPNLSVLRVINCRVRTFPVLPTTIHELYMNGNNLLALPNLSAFRNLIVIELADNNIPAVCAPLPPSLARLDVSMNAIRSFNRDLVPPNCSVSTFSNPYDPYPPPIRVIPQLRGAGAGAGAGMFNDLFDADTAVARPKTVYDDSQNVHTAGVQSSVKKNIDWIMSYTPKRPLKDLIHVCNEVNDVEAASQSIFKRIFKIACKKPGDILKRHQSNEYVMHGATIPRLATRLWERIRETEDIEKRIELQRRFIEEVEDGAHVCANGFMSRLANVFVGFDDACGMQMTHNEILGARVPATMARVRKARGIAENAELTEAANLEVYRATVGDLTELEVDRAQWSVWLEPFSEPVLDGLWESRADWNALPSKEWPSDDDIRDVVAEKGLDGYFWEVSYLKGKFSDNLRRRVNATAAGGSGSSSSA